ncbi:MAG: hypothetical protein AB2A00_10770 [Myxococcota bacterium]
MTLRKMVETLLEGRKVARPTARGVFEQLVLENVAYLVDDERRAATFRALRDQVGITPERILACPPDKLAKVIAEGGMRPGQRAEKLRECARLALEVGPRVLERLHTEEPARARKILKRFPGMGDPGVDKVLLHAGRAVGLAPDSNALRVLVRLGFGREHKSYAATYQSALRATAAEIPDDAAWQLRAHAVLRQHGQEVCRRSAPQCNLCPLLKLCPTVGG